MAIMADIILKGFQNYLDKEWPNWRDHEGGILYSKLYKAFEVGWNNGKVLVRRENTIQGSVVSKKGRRPKTGARSLSL